MDLGKTLEPSPVQSGSLCEGGGDIRGACSESRQPNTGRQSENSTVDRCELRDTA